jgi:Trk K+ transport system NAD-binding subunit
MSRAKRRVGYFLVAFVAATLLFTVAYQVGMTVLEGQPRTFTESLLVVIETFTTTGYGEDAAQWSTPTLRILVILMQLTGVGLLFTTFPFILVPLFEEALATDPPTETDLEDHVVICTFTPRGDTLVDELDAMDVPYVIVESDRETARDLYEDDYEVVHGDPESVETLEAANLDAATALVADDTDERNASIVLSADEVAPDVRVVSIIEDAEVADYQRYAGADRVVSPRRLLGESLANKATTSVSADLDAIEIGEDFEIAELLVQRGADVVGRKIADSRIAEITGVNIIGAWFRGEFVSPPDPDAVIDEHTILLVSGQEEQVEQLRDLTLSKARRYRRGTVVVAGSGEVGTTATDVLAGDGVPTTVVDLEDKPGVDIVGDITDRRTLKESGVADARSVLLALDDDTTTIFAALVVNQFSPETEVIARANERESVSKLYRAGAEYVLALSTVSGRLLASQLLDEEVISPSTQVDVIRTKAPGLAGQSLVQADVRARTNCTVIAAERNGDLITDVGPEFVVRATDALIVAGIDADINRFAELADAGGTEPRDDSD